MGVKWPVSGSAENCDRDMEGLENLVFQVIVSCRDNDRDVVRTNIRHRTNAVDIRRDKSAVVENAACVPMAINTSNEMSIL